MTGRDTVQFIDSSAIISTLGGLSFQNYISDKSHGRFRVSPLVLTEVKDEYVRKLARLRKKAGSFFPTDALPPPQDFITKIQAHLLSMGVEVVETADVTADTIASLLSGRQLGGPPRQGDLADILHALTLAREVVKIGCDGILITGDGAFFQARKNTRQQARLPENLMPLSSHYANILHGLHPEIETRRITVLDPKVLPLFGYHESSEKKA